MIFGENGTRMSETMRGPGETHLIILSFGHVLIFFLLVAQLTSLLHQLKLRPAHIPIMTVYA